jgi:hypothetical protein
MEKIVTIVIDQGELYKDETNNTVKLTGDYIELLPKDSTCRYLKMYPEFGNYVQKNYFPCVKINGEVCPLAIQQEFIFGNTEKFQIESLQINNTFFIGHIVMIISDNYTANK